MRFSILEIKINYKSDAVDDLSAFVIIACLLLCNIS